MIDKDHFYALILAGGGGTRLWPKSRKNSPKHLLKIVGEETLIRLTFSRIVGTIPVERIFVITLESHVDLIKEELPELPAQNIIVEPEGKNTAMAMGLAAAIIQKQTPEAVILNLPADQIISDQTKFLESISSAYHFAQTSENIVTIGIKPTFAHTGLGYINFGEKLDDSEAEGYQVLGFKEKPNLDMAQQFLDNGRYLWNAGIYCWKAETLFKALAKYAPEVSEPVNQIRQALGKDNQTELIAQIYQSAPTLQIDVAVSEKADNILVVKGDFPWSDVGDWKGVYDILKKTWDQSGNLILNQGDYHCIDSQNCLIDAHGKLVVTIGVNNMVVIDTKDAILICDKDRTQEVKKVVEKLSSEKKLGYL